MIWGVGAVMAVGGVAWWLERGETQAWGRAFGVLLAYSLLFLGTLLKIWWTAGQPAVSLDAEAFYYQPLHTFRPNRIAFESVLACNPKPGTEALRVVVAKRSVARELFLNLAVVKGQHRFLDLLEERLSAAGLEKVPGQDHTWTRPDWKE
jgi:hypothetical protein